MPDSIVRGLSLLTVVVRDGQRAFLTRDGKFERLLEPGAHRIFDPRRSYDVEIFDVAGASMTMDRISVLQSVAPEVVEKNFVIAQAEPDEIVFIILDGVARFYAIHRNPRAYWKSVTKVELERVSLKDSLRADPALVDRYGVAKSPIVVDEVVEPHETALLSIDGVLTERLGPGRHVFWQATRKVALRKFDLRSRALEITAQEILTKDRVAIRLTLTVFWSIVDPERASQASEDPANHIYRLSQFAIRDAVTMRTLEELLNERDPVSKEVKDYLTPRSSDLGVSFQEVGVKDVILPGDVRALFNKVVEAERTARANLIRRQEETAATRSLLNTARLLENNPTLLRLKELEALEKLVEKVGRIDLTAGPTSAGFDPLLKGLIRLKDETPSQPDAAGGRNDQS